MQVNRLTNIEPHVFWITAVCQRIQIATHISEDMFVCILMDLNDPQVLNGQRLALQFEEFNIHKARQSFKGTFSIEPCYDEPFVPLFRVVAVS